MKSSWFNYTVLGMISPLVALIQYSRMSFAISFLQWFFSTDHRSTIDIDNIIHFLTKIELVATSILLSGCIFNTNLLTLFLTY